MNLDFFSRQQNFPNGVNWLGNTQGKKIKVCMKIEKPAFFGKEIPSSPFSTLGETLNRGSNFEIG